MKLFVAGKALIVDNKKVLVLREAIYDEGTSAGKWDVPGGRLEPEESLLTGLRREVKEESGLEVEVGEVLAVFDAFQTIKNKDCHIIRVYYQATPLTLEIILGTDHDKYEWIDPFALDGREFVSDLQNVLRKVVI